MRIRHIVRQYAPSVGGLENFVEKLAQSLNALGHDNDVLTLDRVFLSDGARLPSRATINGIEVTRTPMLGHRRLFLPLVPDRLLDGYDVLHVHGIDGMFERIARQRRAPGQIRVATSHGLFFHTPWMRTAKRAYFATITKAAAASYDGLIGNSAADAARLKRLGPDVAEIANGVEPLGSFTAAGNDLLYLGRLSSHKRVDRLIAAMAHPTLSNARLHIVGPAWDVSLESLTEQARALGVADRVVVHGKLSAEQLAVIARECAILVSASLYEGFGMSLIEAMSVGLVPVVEANASFVQLIGKAKVGALTRFDDTEAAATAIAAMRARVDPALRRAAMRFAADFSWSANAQATAAFYAHVREARHVLPHGQTPTSRHLAQRVNASSH